ncbi:FUSC family protein [Solimicrobium silvestre]
MTLQVPSLALSLIMVFFTAQENTVLTRLSGIVLAVGATLAVILSMLLLKMTMDYPVLRIFGAALIGFCGMYFMRISKLGTIGYLVALFVINLQSLVDVSNDPEVVTRALLWVWVAIAYPIVLTITVNYLMLPAKPAQLLAGELHRQLNVVLSQLNAGKVLPAPAPLGLDLIERGVLTLHRHLVFATMGDNHYLLNKSRYLIRINTVDRLHTAAVKLSRLSPCNSSDSSFNQPDLLAALLARCAELQHQFSHETAVSIAAIPISEEKNDDPRIAILHEMAHALNTLAEAEQAPILSATPDKEPQIAADALSNPVYAQFALKTMLATFFCYAFYTAVQWPGIQTSMLTCLIMALPSLGASSHKGLLRVVGCAMGSVAALLATVYVVPHLDGIVGLLMLTLPVIAVGAWIAAGSARISYIGAQLVFAYALALFGQFEPSTNLPEIRDRMIGILLGIGVSITVYSALWPESEQGELKKMLARLLRSIATVARLDQSTQNDITQLRTLDQARLKSWSLLAQNREIQARVALEPGWQYAHDSVTVKMQTWLAQVQEALFAVNWLQTQLAHSERSLSADIDIWSELNSFKASAALQLENMSDMFNEEGTTQPSLQQSFAKFKQEYALISAHEAALSQASNVLSAVHATYESIIQLGNTLPLSQPMQPEQPVRI